MLAGLFDEDAAQYDAQHGPENGGLGIPRPSAPRNSTNLSGLSNLGATCYLNSLLQTLHFTPEFREALFTLGEDDLGAYSEEKGADNSMARVIPIQLQKLFVRLLLLNQQSAGVDALTSSFGWQNNEEFQQHDVQELNRILFSAIESSLLGTPGEQLIAKLYHGTAVQQVTCQRCGRVSEREEAFLDIPVALSGQSGLDQALQETYVDTELLEGANQYRCEKCQQLVDAIRGCRLRKLPSILTFALLRFLYDFQKGERYKDTNRFKFPIELEMSPYCEPLPEGEETRYELFSVVIHSGSTHSGHYTAFIRDVDDLGTWTHPEEDPVQLQADPSSGKVDFIDFESPTELLQELLWQLGGSSPVDRLSKAMQEKTGVSWNKRFKKQFGSINKFLKTCTEFFVIDDMNCVSLKEATGLSTAQHKKIQDSATVEANVEFSTPNGTEQTGGTQTQSDKIQDESNDDTNGREGRVPDNESSPSVDLEMLGELPGSLDAEPLTEEESSAPESRSGLTTSGGQEGQGSASSRGEAETLDSREDTDGPSSRRKASSAKSKKDSPPPSQQWFEFNDTNVSPILAKTIEKMFQGKQSAYMLFYRRKSLHRPQEARGNPTYAVPEHLQMDVARANAKLEEERLQYEKAVNTVRLNILTSAQYVFANGALQSLTDSQPVVLSIDRRRPIVELKTAIVEACPEAAGDLMVIHTAKHLPAGFHLYSCISEDDCSMITDAGVTNDSYLFVWDGNQVGGEALQVGESCEPILLNVAYPSRDGEESELVSGFSKSSTLGELRSILADLLGCRSNQIAISQVKVTGSTGQPVVVVLSSSKDKQSLAELKFSNGDRLAAEADIKKGVKTLAHSVADKQRKMVSLIVEDRCSPLPSDLASYPVFPLEVSKDELLSTLKTLILSKIGITEVEGGGRLRADDESTGTGPPLHEHQTVSDAQLESGLRIVVEPGQAPLSSQLALQCVVHPAKSDAEVCEVILERATTVAACCTTMVEAAGLQGSQWHLRRTNWCGEAAELLEDETATLDQERLKSGDLLLIEEGKLPPKGFIRLPVFLYHPSSHPSPPPPPSSHDTQHGILSWMIDSLQGLMDCSPSASNPEGHVEDETKMGGEKDEEVPLHLLSPSLFYPPVPGELSEVGTVEVSKDSSLLDLKTLILTLPAFEDASVSTPAFLRVSELVKNRPGKVFKQPQQTLRRLKLTSDTSVCCTILSHEEILPTTAVVFNLQIRTPGQRRYGPPTEVIYDTAHSSAPQGLIRHIAALLDVPSERVQLAKHKLESFDWIRIEESQSEGSKKGKKKGRGGGKVNVKNAPVQLRDGDTIGVKDLQYDPDYQDDFSTPLDDKGKRILTAIQEEKKRKRKAKPGTGDILSGGSYRRRPEVGIRIFVPDYRAKKT